MRLNTGDMVTACFEVGRGLPMILVHGLGDDHRSWRKLIGHLALDHRVILYDVRGHGESSLGRADGTLDQLAADLPRVMDALGIESADLVGFSMGGTIVMKVAIEQPGRVRRLFPVATSSRLSRAVAPWYLERAALAEAGGERVFDLMREDVEAQYALTPEEIEPAYQLKRQANADPAGYANACRAMAGLLERPLDPDLGRITAPTLVISAVEDRHCPVRAGEIIRDRIPGARLQVIERAAHPVMVQQPATLAAAITGFAG